MRYSDILQELKARSNPEAVAGMARFGINPHNTYGISMPELRALAKQIGAEHQLARRLWRSGFHEARIVAGMIDLPELVDEAQMEEWARDFDSWDVCDQTCNNLFHRTRLVHLKAAEWSRREEEFVKRAGFVLVANLAVHDHEAPDKVFVKYLAMIKRESYDERNFVKKAVNWALRQIGKRNIYLNRRAIRTAREIQAMDYASARWIGADALRELSSMEVKRKLVRQNERVAGAGIE